MELTSFDWTIITIVVSTLVGLAVFFLKDVFKKNDKQGDDIHEIQKDYATRGELNSAATALRGEMRGIGGRVDAHERDINEIKRTYVTEAKLKEMRAELRDETKRLAADVAEIKDNYLTKDDYYRKQVDTDRKLDRIYELLITEKGGPGHG